MSQSAAFQKAIKLAIEAANIQQDAVSVPFFDGAPKDRPYPSITVGPSFMVPDDADCIDGREETLQIDVWGRDQGRLNKCKAVVDAVYDALHDIDLAMDDPYAANTCRVSLVRVFKDPDGITAHGAIQVTGLLETV